MTSKGLTDNLFISQLYTEHHDWLLRWIERKVSCRLQAEDHAHDTFLRVITSHQPNELREPRAFLVTVAKNLLLNHWRHSAIEQAYLESLGAYSEALTPSLEENAIILATLQEIDDLLRQLPEKVRKAFLMVQLAGLTHVEIAQKLGVSDRMVKKYVARAMLHCLSANL